MLLGCTLIKYGKSMEKLLTLRLQEAFSPSQFTLLN